jgi:O-antigen ligase
MTFPATESRAQPITLLGIFSLACLAMMIVIPFLVTYHVPPIASFYKEWLAALFGVLASLFLVGRNRAKFQFPPVALVPLSLIILLALQVKIIQPDYWQNQFIAALYLGLSTVIMILAANLRHVISLNRIVPILAWSFVVATVLILLLMVISKFIDPKGELAFWILNGRAGNVGQTNHFSNFVSLGLGSLLYLRFTNRLNSWLTIVISACILLALAQAGQRMAILYVGLMSVGGWLLARNIAKQQVLNMKPVNLLWLIPGFIAAQLIVPFLTFLDPAMVPAKRLVENIGGESSRLMLLDQGWKVFQSNPWIGIGWGEFAWYNFNVTEEYPGLKGLWSHVHNIVMQLLTETGIAGALIFLSGMLYWFREQFLAKLDIDRWWILALLSILAVHSMLEFPLWYTHFLAFASLLLGLSSEQNFSLRFKLAPIAFASVFIFSCWSLGSLIADYQRLEQAISTLRQEGLPQSRIEENLVSFNEIRKETVFTPYADNFFVRVLPNNKQFFADKLTLSQLVVENWPGKIETYTHAFLLAMNDRPLEAQQMMQKAIKQYPEYRETFHRFVLQRVARGDNLLLPILIIIQDPYQSLE